MTFWYGYPLSEAEIEFGKVSQATFRKAIWNEGCAPIYEAASNYFRMPFMDEWEPEFGTLEDEDGYEKEIANLWFVSESALPILEANNEFVIWVPKLSAYIWCDTSFQVYGQFTDINVGGNNESED